MKKIFYSLILMMVIVCFSPNNTIAMENSDVLQAKKRHVFDNAYEVITPQ